MTVHYTMASLSAHNIAYTTQVNNASGARRLASSEVIIQLYSPRSIERCAKL